MANQAVPNGKPRKTASKKTSRTPLLDEAKKSTPHAGGTWDKSAARNLAMEAANQTSADMKLIDFLNLAFRYKDVAGWKNVLVATAVKYGVLTSRNFSD